MAKHITLQQLATVVTGMATKNDARFRKIADSYTKTEVDQKIQDATAGAVGAVYKPAGTIEGSELVAGLLVQPNYGNVYNIASELAITSANEGLFKDRVAGDTIFEGDNVGVIEKGTYSAATGVAVAGTEYFTRSGEEGSYVYTKAEVTVGGDVTGLYQKDYIFDVLAAFINYTEGDGIDITNRGISIALGSTTNGLSVDNGLQLAGATADTHGYVVTEDTVAVAGKVYFERTGSDPDYVYTEKTGLVVGETSVTGLYEDEVTTEGTGGALSASDKYKLDQFSEATAQDIQNIIDGIYAS